MRSLLFLAALSLPVFCQTLPQIEGETLLGQKLNLPDAAAGNAAALVLGFSHGSQNQIKAWGERLNTQFPESSGSTRLSP